MRARERRVARVKLDVEMWPFRKAGREKETTNDLLRAVRQTLGIPIKEIMGEMGVGRSAVFDLEMRERKKTITLQSLGRMAEAMGCKVVYGVVPIDGGTLEHMAEKRLWKAVLGDRGAGEQENEKTGDTRREQEAESRERGVGGTVDGERCGAEIWQ
jgi:transcriptional regulator with XRE-family HTH domain